MELPRLDKFKLITYQNIDIDERNVVTLLYQPLIGCKAFSLYLTLWSLIDRSRLKTPIYLHKKLYDILNSTPKEFSDARKKLEAIGLLVVYQNEEMYLYELKAPLSAEEFIKDGNLGAYLFKEIGQYNYDRVLATERALKQGGARTTIFRPVLFMDNTLTKWARNDILEKDDELETRYVVILIRRY